MPAPDPIWIFIEKLESAKMRYLVTGSIATIFYGQPRLTHDIDLVLHLKTDEVKKLIEVFSLTEFYCPPEEVIHIEMSRRPYGHFNLIHHKTGFKADVYLEGNDPLHQWAFKNKRQISLSDSQSIWLAPPEYLIIRKLEFYREGGSEKHLKDIKGMLPQVRTQLALDYLNSQLKQRGLEDLWQQVQDS